MESGITWYDVLGVLPGAEARKIKQKYDSKAALLRPELTSGAPPDVLTAVARVQELLDTARESFRDRARREHGGDEGLPTSVTVVITHRRQDKRIGRMPGAATLSAKGITASVSWPGRG